MTCGVTKLGSYCRLPKDADDNLATLLSTTATNPSSHRADCLGLASSTATRLRRAPELAAWINRIASQAEAESSLKGCVDSWSDLRPEN
jgi:hypothetical protein